MNFTKIVTLLLLMALSGSTTQAKAPCRKKNRQSIRLLESYTQRTIPGRRESPISANTFFIIEWNYKTYPETFFWRGENGWFPCNMLKAHKVNTTNPHNIPKGLFYFTEFAANDKINRGDTLQLSPVAGGKFPIPPEIKLTDTNYIYYKTDCSSWLKIKVDSILKKHDLVTP